MDGNQHACIAEKFITILFFSHKDISSDKSEMSFFVS